jgi:hypothetical protein
MVGVAVEMLQTDEGRSPREEATGRLISSYPWEEWEELRRILGLTAELILKTRWTFCEGPMQISAPRKGRATST